MFLINLGKYISPLSLKGKIKAWHLHKEATLNYACVYGEVKLVLFDERKGSSTFWKLSRIIIINKNYNLITIPPNIWNGFKGCNDQFQL